MIERGAEVRNANGAEIGNGKRAEAGKGNGAEAKNADAAGLGVEIADSEAAIEVPSRLFCLELHVCCFSVKMWKVKVSLCFLNWPIIILEKKVRG